MSKILIGVMTCHKYRYFNTYHSDGPGGYRVQLIRDTWKNLVPPGVDFKFFYGRSNSTPKEDEVFLDEYDGFYGTTRKVRAMLKYSHDLGYEHLLQLDDDVFIDVPAMLKSDFANYDYHGCATKMINGVNWPGGSEVPFTFVCNFAVWFSRRSMEILSKADPGYTDFEKDFNLQQYLASDNVQKIKWHADLWNGCILSNHGISAHGDDRYVFDVMGGYPIENALAIHVTPRFELMELLYNRVRNQQ
jgi:hypothetical protein